MSKRKGTKRRRLAEEARQGGRRPPPAERGALAAPEMPYFAGSRVLVLGDGDFSFSRALAELRGAAGGGGAGIVATGFDSEADVLRKYGEQCRANIAALERSGATVLFGVDATRADSCERLSAWRARCQFAVFNFPHAAAGIKDEAENARLHRALIRGMLRASAAMLDPRGAAGPGEAHVTLRRGRPYSQWAVATLADGSEGLRYLREVPFDPGLYPGYRHRRTRGLAQTRPDTAEGSVPNGAVTRGEGSVTYCFARCGPPG